MKIIILIFSFFCFSSAQVMTHISGAGTAESSSGKNFSDNFNRANVAPPSGDWTQVYGSDWSIASNELVVTNISSGQTLAYDSTCDGVTQYQCIQAVSDVGFHFMFRYTGTASDGYYVITQHNGGVDTYWTVFDNGGWVVDVNSGDTFSVDNGDYAGCTVQGTGNSTIVSLWDLGPTPASFTPYDKDNWLNGSDTADLILTDDPGVNAADTGVKIGLAGYGSSGNVVLDNWYGGDTE